MKSVISKSVISVISATILCFAIGGSAAFAQSAAAPTKPAAPAVPIAAAPTAAPAKIAKPKLSPDEKKKISLACSAQATEKQLHGKDRRTFRANCIRHGGATT